MTEFLVILASVVVLDALFVVARWRAVSARKGG